MSDALTEMFMRIQQAEEDAWRQAQNKVIGSWESDSGVGTDFVSSADYTTIPSVITTRQQPSFPMQGQADPYAARRFDPLNYRSRMNPNVEDNLSATAAGMRYEGMPGAVTRRAPYYENWKGYERTKGPSIVEQIDEFLNRSE